MGEGRDEEGRNGQRGGGRVAPKLTLGPQNYFPGAGAGRSYLRATFAKTYVRDYLHIPQQLHAAVGVSRSFYGTISLSGATSGHVCIEAAEKKTRSRRCGGDAR